MGGWRALAAMGVALGLCLGAGAARGAGASNAAYQIDVKPTGEYTAGTSAGHPVWRESLLFGGQDVPNGETTFNTIRSCGTTTDYRLTSDSCRADVGFACTRLDAVATTTHRMVTGTSPASVGFQTTWDLASAGDDLLVVQEIVIEGEDVTDSVVRVTLCITNRAPSNAVLGVRFLWDMQTDRVDGPYRPCSTKRARPD